MALLVPCAGWAQVVTSETVIEKLQTPVHLYLGKTDLGSVAMRLSEQCGITIEPSDYLKDREMVVQLDGITARAALEALSEMNDWTWKETPEKHILIARQASRLPATPAYVFRRIHAAMPRDLREFLGVIPRSETPVTYINPFEIEADPLQTQRMKESRDRLWRLLQDTQTDLYGSLPQSVILGTPYAFAKMSNRQKNDLMAQILFRVFDELLAKRSEFMVGDLLPYAHDPSLAVLSLTGNEFKVNTIFKIPNGQMSAGFTVELQK